MIKFRSFSEKDIDDLVLLLNNEKVSRFTSDNIPFPYGKEDANKFLGKIKVLPTGYMNAVILNGKLIGGAGIHPQEMNLKTNVEIGYWLAEEFWGKGFTTEIVKMLIDFIKESKKYHKIFARTMSGNIGSEKVLQKNGFVLEGILKEHIFKRGEYLDEKYWGFILP